MNYLHAHTHRHQAIGRKTELCITYAHGGLGRSPGQVCLADRQLRDVKPVRYPLAVAHGFGHKRAMFVGQIAFAL